MGANLSLSFIIPAYRAESFIKKDLERLVAELGKESSDFEVICVVDGTEADKTYEVAKEVELKYPQKVNVYGYRVNRGKGYAVRYGMRKARGSLIGFIDAGGEISPESIKNLLKIQKTKNADIVVGSKRHENSNISYPLFRKLLSLAYFYLVKMLFRVKVSDTQAGLKIFKRKVLEEVLPNASINGFAFDIEILVGARFAGFERIFDAPIVVSGYGKEKSVIEKGGVLRATAQMFWDTLSLYCRIKLEKL